MISILPFFRATACLKVYWHLTKLIVQSGTDCLGQEQPRGLLITFLVLKEIVNDHSVPGQSAKQETKLK